MITVQSLVNWEVESDLWELMMIHITDDDRILNGMDESEASKAC